MELENKYKLTIAIPTYNGEKTIKNLLDSLIMQCNESVELLIVDNCSMDNTPNIINKYKNDYSKLKYVRNDENIGPDANFLKCMKLAEGEYTWLISDDDVVTDNAIKNVLNYIEKYKDISLIYATTVDFRGKYEGIENCQKHKPLADNDIYTNDKKIFMKYAGYYWGFMSSFICNTNKFNEISNPEKFYGTYWLQSYIHALCAKEKDSYLGIISSPCIGAGIYVNVPNYDSATVNGIYYKKMFDFMIKECNYDKKQLNKLYSKRICHLSRHDIIKEKASNEKKINKKTLYQCTCRLLNAWITVYPLFLIPSFLCRKALEIYKRNRGMKAAIVNNRPE